MVSMLHTGSDKYTASRYAFSFAWESSYGHVVRLIERLDLMRGLIVDLGCGSATVAEPLGERGYEYIGVDIDSAALEYVSARGFETHQLDLRYVDRLPAELVKMANGRRVAAIMLLDVIEHLPETQPFLLSLRDALEQLGRPLLFLSVPNVAHIDVGAKLVFGRWNYRPTGLLDSTHLQFFTAERLGEETRASGFLEVDAHDFELYSSDQYFPSDHPALSSESPVAQAMRAWREAVDQHGHTVQFVRALAVADLETHKSDSIVSPSEKPFMTVVMRTQGTRLANLRDALTCLAAQTSDDFVVLLMVHVDRPDFALPSVNSIVDDFHHTFSSRVTVVHVAGGDRARPLNEALGRLRSKYVAFLDDDDLVTANWIETFASVAVDGAIVRSVAAVRHVSKSPDSHLTPYSVESGLEFRYASEFDPVHHLWGNETPICTFAVPCSLIETFELRFDEQIHILEDWDFLMRCVAFAPIRDTREVTSIYQMWGTGESSASLHDVELWQATQRILQGRMNQRPLVFPAGTADLLVSMCKRLGELDAAHAEMLAARTQVMEHASTIEEQAGELGVLYHKYFMIINSRRWRIMGPFAAIANTLRRRR